MKKWLKITLIVLAALVVAGGLFTGGYLLARRAMLRSPFMMSNNEWRAYDERSVMPNGMMPGGMMPRGGRQSGGMMNYDDRAQGMGPGMMNDDVGAQCMGGGMMNSDCPAATTNATPLSLEEAQSAAQAYLATLDNDDLKIAEIMIFDNNAYVLVSETSTGLGAFELLVNSGASVAYPEFGPNLMWNLKYGGLNHANMMRGHGMGTTGLTGEVVTDASAEMTLSAEAAVQAAQAYLDENLPGATASAEPMQFYGYYTLDYEVDGAPAGMLSVNGFSGQIFTHTWHGTFVEEQSY